MPVTKILITGGAGFVGSNLSLMFKKTNANTTVIAFDNLKRRGSNLNVERLLAGGVNFVHGDVRNKEDLVDVGSVDFIIDCSAEPSVSAGYEDGTEYLINTNLVGSLNCIEVARSYAAGLIFMSTSRVYPINALRSVGLEEEETRFTLADVQQLPGVGPIGIGEEFPSIGSKSLYGASKFASEVMALEYSEAFNFPVVVNRCSNIAGPWQMGKVDQGVASLWVASHFWKRKLSYNGFGGTGKQVRDFLHVKDLFDLVQRELSVIEKISGSVFNVGGGIANSLSLAELTEICREITGFKIPVGKTPQSSDVDVPYYVSDNRRVCGATGWQPQADNREIIGDIYEWLVRHRDDLKNVLA